jgi:hypothetical protein
MVVGSSILLFKVLETLLAYGLWLYTLHRTTEVEVGMSGFRGVSFSHSKGCLINKIKAPRSLIHNPASSVGRAFGS